MDKIKMIEKVARAESRVYDADTKLSAALTKLGETVSKATGEKFVAEMCHGGEIEFRHAGDDGIAIDDFEVVGIESIYSMIHEK